MNIQENIENKKEREAKVLSGDIFIIDSYRNGILIKTAYKTLQEVPLLLLSGVGVLNGDLMEYVR